MIRWVAGLVISLLVLLPFVSPVYGEPQPSLSYDMLIDTEGIGLITISFIDPRQSGIRNFWLLLPKDLDFAKSSWSGRFLNKSKPIEGSQVGTSYVFYDNVTIWYESPFSIDFKWNMSYAALIFEPDALTFSPAIDFSPALQPTFTIHLPNSTTRVTEFSLSPIQRRGLNYTFRATQDSRIAVAFQVKGTPSMVVLNSSRFSLKSPARYTTLGKRIVSFYENVTPSLDSIFRTSLSGIKVEFFVPKTLDEISVGGFVPIGSAHRLGSVFLNLFWVRTKEGYFESIAAHELVHHYLFSAGVSTNLLWFHEGLANYVGIGVSRSAGQGGVSTGEDLVNEARSIAKQGLTFVYRWRPDYEVPGYTTFQHYAASYYIVANISQTLASPKDEVIPGQIFLSSLFDNLRKSGSRLDTTDRLATLAFISANMSALSYRALSPFGLRVDPFRMHYANITANGITPASFSELVIAPLIAPSIYAAYNQTVFVDPARAEMIIWEAFRLVNGLWTSFIFFLFLLTLGVLIRRLESL